MRSGPERLALVIAIVIAAAAAHAGRAEANAGNPRQGGAPAGEPGGMGAVAIAREELVIDLRPLARADGLALVTATYHLESRAGARRLELVFATGSAAAGLRVALDGGPVPFELAPGAELPESWRPPRVTPRLGGGELGYEVGLEATPARFQLDVPPGAHELVIAYGADAARYHAGEPTVLRQLAYVLSPARTWAGFGGLDVTVHVPPGWRAAVAPALRREGDTLRGAFAAIPADALGITAQAPAGAAYAIARYAAGALFALILLGGGFGVVRWTRARERRRALRGPSALAAIGRGLVWAAAVAAAGAIAISWPEGLLPDGQADHRGYKQLPAIAGVALATVAACIIGAIASYGAARRVHAAAERPAPED